MIVKDSQGKDIEIEVHGMRDEVEITGAYYVDSDDEVSDSEIDRIMEVYAAEIDQDALESAMSAAETYYEGDR